MLIHPEINPIALQIGPLAMRWYGLMYLLAFIQFLVLGRYRARQCAAQGWRSSHVDDMLLYGMLGVVLGGRLGYCVFYKPAYYLSYPLEVFAVWQGGMSFHGGLLGVIVALWFYGRRNGRSFFAVTDFAAPLVPLGLAAGRMGNFINAELVGRSADPSLPWSMIFPTVDTVARHPSQLYQLGMEGLWLFVIVWLYARCVRPEARVSGLFLLGYGTFRFIAEFFREPDDYLGILSLGMTMGQWLSVPMITMGGYWFLRPVPPKRGAT